MTGFLGIDIGTSSVKAVLVDDVGTVVAQASVPLAVHRPRPGRVEQDAESWWAATGTAVAEIRLRAPSAFAALGAIGLSGQMHAALPLDRQGRALRPAILWNDGRATAECAALTDAVAGLAGIAGVAAMPGFTAPKIAWLRAHEPEVFRRAAMWLPAKDYVRWRLAGVYATDMVDAAGTLLFDEARRDWSDEILAAVGLSRDRLPRLCEGSRRAGVLSGEVAGRWGLDRPVVIAAGGGDAAAGAVGIGAVNAGDAFVSLGTSAQVAVVRDRYDPVPEGMIHAFAHAIPGRWFNMAALLNGASCLEWVCRLLGETDVAAVLARVGVMPAHPSPVVFLPYLSGERTPHNDPDARGVLAGLDASTTAGEIVQAVLEGVAFCLADGVRAFGPASVPPGPLPVIGGGARSRVWLGIVASVLNRPVQRLAGGEHGPASGAARLARMALTGEASDAVCVKPAVVETVEPEATLAAAYRDRLEVFRALYRDLKAARAGS